MAKRKGKTKSFEELLSFVETLVRDLEGGDLGLEEAMNRYSDGVKALSACRQVLDEAEKKIEILIRGADGELAAKPFDPDSSADPAPAKARKKTPRKKDTDTPEGGEGLLF